MYIYLVKTNHSAKLPNVGTHERNESEANISNSESASKELLNEAESREMNSTTKYIETPGNKSKHLLSSK